MIKTETLFCPLSSCPARPSQVSCLPQHCNRRTLCRCRTRPTGFMCNARSTYIRHGKCNWTACVLRYIPPHDSVPYFCEYWCNHALFVDYHNANTVVKNMAARGSTGRDDLYKSLRAKTRRRGNTAPGTDSASCRSRLPLAFFSLAYGGSTFISGLYKRHAFPVLPPVKTLRRRHTAKVTDCTVNGVAEKRHIFYVHTDG